MSRAIDRFVIFLRRNSFRIGIIAVLAIVVTLTAAHPALAVTNQTWGGLDKPLSWLAAIAMAVAELLGNLVLAILNVCIPVMQYQGFTSSPVVIAGWAITRDVVNMFFVVILIVIAMGTIFGHSRFQWKQQVPKLLIFAIVINFSKTICGLLIDFAQVIMITFANALKDIAGGNFIQLLGLGDIFSLSQNAQVVMDSAAGTGSASAFDWFAAGVAAVLMMVWVLAVVLMLLVVLVYRVVMLWILIVLAPLAWFMGGAGGIFKSGGGGYEEWWKNFICYTSIGPIITFFLWLTLAVAGSGFIAATDPGFSSVAPGGNLNDNIGFVTKIFEWQRLTSFVIGMAMLMVGFDTASKICQGTKGPGFQALLKAGQGVPGQIGSYVGGQARKYGGKGLAAGWSGSKSFAAGAGVGLVGAAVGGGTMKERGARMLPTATGQAARAQGLRNISKKLPASLNTVSRSLSMSADESQKDLADRIKKGAEEDFKGASTETKVDFLKNMAAGGMPVTPGARKAALGLFAEAIKDPGMREKLEAAGVLKTLYDSHGQTLKNFVRNTPDAKMFEEFELGRPDVTGSFARINSEEDLRKLDPTALAKLKGDAGFERQLASFKTSVRDASGNSLSGLQFLNEGHGSGKQAKAWRDGMAGVYAGMTNVNLAMVPDADIAKVADGALLSRHASLTKKPDSVARMLAQGGVGARERVMSDASLRNEINNRLFKRETAPNSGTFVVDAAKIKNEVKANPLAIQNVTQGDASGSLSTAIADAYDVDTVNELLRTYRMSSADAQAEQEVTTIANVLDAYSSAASSAWASGNTAAAVEYNVKRNDLITSLEGVHGGGSAGIQSQLDAQHAALTARETALRAVATRTTDQTRELNRVTADIARNRSRWSMH